MTRTITPATTRELSLDEYLSTPFTNQRQEVIDGVIVPMPTPTVNHQMILGSVFMLVSTHVGGARLGVVLMAPCDLLIRTEPKLRMRQPDMMYFSAARIAPEDLRRMRYGEIAPDLAVEIRSPSETPAGWADKLADYAEIGVAEVWRVNPEARAVEVLGLREGRYAVLGTYPAEAQLVSAVLPGLDAPVAALFA